MAIEEVSTAGGVEIEVGASVVEASVIDSTDVVARADVNSIEVDSVETAAGGAVVSISGDVVVATAGRAISEVAEVIMAAGGGTVSVGTEDEVGSGVDVAGYMN